MEEPAGKREGTDRSAERFRGSEGPRATGGAAGRAPAGGGEGCRREAHLGASSSSSSSLRRGGEGAGECALCPAKGPADPRPGALRAGRCRSGAPEAAPSHRPALPGRDRHCGSHPRAEGSGMGAEGGAGRGGGGCGRVPSPLISSEPGRRSAADPRPLSPPGGSAGCCPPRTEPSRGCRCCRHPRRDLRREGRGRAAGPR